jgi:hypothetical protein
MRCFITSFLVVALACPAMCQIIGTEYFVDRDPGYNAATYLSVTSGMDISQNVTVMLSAIPQGYHVLGYRAKDAQGHWSITTLYSFYTVPATPTGIVASEFFMDTDPGNGNATGIPVAVGSDNVLKYVVPLSNSNIGFHIMGLRSKDNKGTWSHTLLYPFYVVAATPTSIIANEYFVDTDPGYGNANSIPVAVNNNNVLTYTVPLSSYSAGFHIMGLRSEDNKRTWSHTMLYGFYINESNTPVNITALKYYYTNSTSTTDIFTYQVPVPSTNVALNFNANLSQLANNQDYDMHIWAINEKGVRSEVLIYHISASMLPVTTTPLVGVLSSNFTTVLSWKTLTETNNKGFNIERNDGSGWNKIGFVNGQGNSNVSINYSFIDASILAGNQYTYRYKQLDIDDRFTYSNTVLIKVPAQANVLSIKTAPNPFYGKTTIQYNLPNSGNVTIKLFDFNGKQIATILNRNQLAGSYKLALDASAFRLASGTYYLRLANENSVVESKIVLIR